MHGIECGEENGCPQDETRDRYDEEKKRPQKANARPEKDGASC